MTRRSEHGFSFWLAALVCAVACACSAPGGGDSSASEDVAGLEGLPSRGPLRVEDSLRVAPGEYLRSDDAGEGVLRIQGRRDVVVDLRGVRIIGQGEDAPLDAAQGIGILIEDCDRVTIRGGELGGFHGCVVIRNSTEVTLEGMRFDGYRAERLRGTSAVSDTADLIDLENMPATAWLERFGAAVAVLDSSRVTVRDCTARRGQNGVLLLRSEECEVYGNDFSFLSGWGVALARSSNNRVAHNRLDYVARSHASGGPGEGFNGAGILLGNRSSRNTFAWNSATRCGYGVLVQAPHDTNDPAAASEDNLFYRNDFSHAIGQGLLALGGRGNWVVANELTGTLGGGVRARACTSWVFYANELRDVPGAGISLEGSRECLVVGNTFRECDRGLEVRPLVLAPRGTQGAEAEHWVLDNHFRENLQDLVFEQSRGLVVAGNRFEGSRPEAHLVELVGEGAPNAKQNEVWAWLMGPEGRTPSGRAWRSSLRRAGDESHPWMRDVQRFEPPTVPGSALAKLTRAPEGLQGLLIDTHGPWDFAGPRPKPDFATSGGLLGGVTWEATWFRFDTTKDPRGDVDAWRALAFDPLHRDRVTRWVDPWGGADVRERVGVRDFGLIATARVSVPETGTYHLSILSDDGVRLSVDGEVVYEDWTWHPARRASATFELKAGRRELRLEYFQLEGEAALALDLAPVASPLPRARAGRAGTGPRPAATGASSPP